MAFFDKRFKAASVRALASVVLFTSQLRYKRLLADYTVYMIARTVPL
jgi:hypothetical protein